MFGTPWKRDRYAFGVISTGRDLRLALFLTLGGVSALLASYAQAFVGPRLLVLPVVLISVAVAGQGRDLAARVCVVVLPFVAFVRRITAGPAAYVYNDPLALLGVVLLIPTVLAIHHLPRQGPGRWINALLVWTIFSSTFAVLRGGSPITIAYGAATNALPLLVGALVASGSYRALPRFVISAVPITAVVASIYSLTQWAAPAPWDLAWLRTQATLLVSVGQPSAGNFRIFGTAESPSALALTIGLAAACVGTALITQPMRRGLWAARIAVMSLFILVLALTSVRTSLFALPVALLAVMVCDRKIPRVIIAPIAALLIGAVLIVPTLLASSSSSQSRYDIGNLSQDESFQARSELLPQFAQSALNAPFGQGAGTTGLAGRLDAVGSSAAYVENIDNGYLTRLAETGVPGFLLFAVAVMACARPGLRRIRGGRSLPADKASLAIVVFFLFSDLSGPTTSLINGVLFWVALGALAQSPNLREDMVPPPPQYG